MPYLDKAGLAYLWQKIKTALTGKQNILTGGAAGQFLSKASDADGDTQWVDPPAGGGSAGEIYSAEETAIGTWINGKTLYRKVIEGVTPSSSEQAGIVASFSSKATMIRVYGAVIAEPYKYPVPNVYGSSSIGLAVHDNGSVSCRVSGTDYLSKQIFVVGEYTKPDKPSKPEIPDGPPEEGTD